MDRELELKSSVQQRYRRRRYYEDAAVVNGIVTMLREFYDDLENDEPELFENCVALNFNLSEEDLRWGM